MLKKNPVLYSLIIAMLAGLATFFFVKYKKNNASVAPASGRLIDIDTAALSSWEVRPGGTELSYTIFKDEGKWKMKLHDGEVVDPDKDYLRRALLHLTTFKADSVVTSDSTQWPKYKIGNNEGTNIQVYERGKLKTEFIIGDYFFARGNQSAYYIRKKGNTTVYVTVGPYLGGSVAAPVGSMRKKKLVDIPPLDITQLVFIKPNEHFDVVRGPGTYLVDGHVADDPKTLVYLKQLSQLNITHFGKSSGRGAEYVLVIQHREAEPVRLEASHNDKGKWIIQSSINHGNYLEGDEEMINTLFPGKSYFQR